MHRRWSIGSTLGSFVFASALVLVLAGCGSSTPSTGSSPTATTAPTTAAATSAAAPTTASAATASATATTASPAATTATTTTPAAAGSASPAASPVARGTAALQVKTDPTLGQILTDSLGMTLYTYAKDTANTSNCTGQCLANWPALPAAATSSLPSGVPGTLGTITRSDGTSQVTYNGHPLYYFIGDKLPGDTKGNGLASGAWKVVPPAAS